MRLLTYPLSQLYKMITSVRNWAYDKKYFTETAFAVPIVSVGNLTAGGTGKTPILCELVRWALTQNLRPAVISRGYKGQVAGVQKVGPTGTALIFGDEPMMIANRFPTVPVYVGGDRVEVMKKLLAEEKVDLVFADDAFQHRRLARQLNIVIFDATEKIENYRLLPLGRARESISGLARADVIMLNKVNLVGPNDKNKIYDFLELHAPQLIPQVIECEYYINEIKNLATGEPQSLHKNEKIILISGIGNPQALERLVRQNYNVQKHFVFRDHYPYSAEKIREILNEAKSLNITKILMTEKDAIKVRDLEIDLESFWQTCLTVKIGLKARLLYERIQQLTR